MDAGRTGLPPKLGHAPAIPLVNSGCALLYVRGLDRLARLPVDDRRRGVVSPEKRKAVTAFRDPAPRNRCGFRDPVPSPDSPSEPGGVARFVARRNDAPGQRSPARLIGKWRERGPAVWIHRMAR